jgi:hypothetical protein
MILSNLIGALSGGIMDQITLGFLGTDTTTDQNLSLRIFLASPGGSAWWNVYRAGFPPAFQRFVAEEILSSEPPTA